MCRQPLRGQPLRQLRGRLDETCRIGAGLRARAGLLVLGLLLGLACAEGSLAGLEDLLQTAGGAGSESRLVEGLKEALQVSTGNAVERTSRADGFLANPRIRIPLPESVEPLADGLRSLGLGARVDELEVSMNRAAERAAGEAAPVFVDAIRGIRIDDARNLLEGGDTAITDYFRRTTRDALRARFEPIVSEKVNEVGLVRLYGDLVRRYAALPFAKDVPPDLTSYVTERSLAGLFTVLGEEETRIRTDPGARVTALLREVFGS